MATLRALQPQDEISHYRIVSPLASGGMGQVYLAQDRTLERSVALKVLPPELVTNQERVQRFVREAKSASSLNHPNIVTIYEIGQDEVRSSLPHEAEGESSSVHFISMELVSGETLTTKIHHEKTDLRTMMGYLAQAAEGLSKAHAAGIVHRDLKPSNIMVSRDGFAKILDFGLAKLTEAGPGDPEATQGPTEVEEGTGIGSVVGTVGYMSPEQVQGKAVDHRSDIFSFGCVLYEAVTRRKPFAAESSIETLHKIIHESPAPVEGLNTTVPAEVRRLIRRCLAKNPDQRFQSARDLAIDLREIVDEYDRLSASGSSGTVVDAVAGTRSRRVPWPVVAGAVTVALLGVSLAAWTLWRSGTTGGGGRQRMTIATVTNRGDVGSVALSADGRYLAYTAGTPPNVSLVVHQVATGSESTILEGPRDLPWGIQGGVSFSPDGNFIYYLAGESKAWEARTLYRIPTLGGAPERLLYDVDTPVSFSPDGSQACFQRGEPLTNSTAIFIMDVRSRTERLLTRVTVPEIVFSMPAWSPDGKRIAALFVSQTTFTGQRIKLYRAKDGKEEAVITPSWRQSFELAWLPDGSGWVVRGGDAEGGQLGIQPYPNGSIHRVTNDNAFYTSISTGTDSLLAARRGQAIASLWSAAIGGPVVQEISAHTPEHSVLDLAPADGGRVLYRSRKDGDLALYVRDRDGNVKPLTSTSGGILAYRVAGNLVVLLEREGGLFACDLQGRNRRRLSGSSVATLLALSPDGSHVLAQLDGRPTEVWSLPTRGGDAWMFDHYWFGQPSFSPDGSRLATRGFGVDDAHGMYLAFQRIVSFPEGKEIAKVATDARWRTSPRWDPDGKSLVFAGSAGEGSDAVWRWRIDQPEPERVFTWPHGRVSEMEWSPDGSKLLVRSDDGQVSNIWICDTDGADPAQLTDFKSGDVFDADWSIDGKAIHFTQGISSSDVVLIRNYR